MLDASLLTLPLAALALGLGYLLGSIPFGLLLTRMAGTADIRTVGSGNIGATNVLRTGHKGLAAATFLGDALKGTVAVLLAGMWGPAAAVIAGVGAFLGHLFPVWLGFKGGKGVATFLGVLLGLWWPGALVFAGLWLAVAGLTRYSSLAALVASGITPVFVFFAGQHVTALALLLLVGLLFYMHRANIGRLMAGTEGKIGQKG